jgi:lipopolysaccharide transport protein LptA
MKFKAANPDNKAPRNLTVSFTLAILMLFASTLQSQSGTESHEYSADGETTIENINGMRVITLRDNVYVRQNGIELTGAIAILEYSQENQLQKVTLTGSPANFSQIDQESPDIITGHSDTITYYAGTESVVEFIGNASFSQPGTNLLCAQIRHIIESGATSGQACSGSLSPQSN